MTLNDNPRVTAERRLRINIGRLSRLNAKYQKWSLERENGVVARMRWTGITHEQLDRAAEVRKMMSAQIRMDEKFLKAFR